MNIGGAFVIKDIAVVDGQKGMFARMPFRSYKGANGETKYSDIAQGRFYRHENGCASDESTPQAVL